MLDEIVRQAGARHGDAALYVMPDGAVLTYHQLDTCSDEAARGLMARGVRAGDVVALLLPSGAAYAVAYAAAAEVLEVAEAGEPGDALAELRRGAPGDALPTLEPDPERPVAVVFTSGTTGDPKGAVFAGRQLAAIGEIDGG